MWENEKVIVGRSEGMMRDEKNGKYWGRRLCLG